MTEILDYLTLNTTHDHLTSLYGDVTDVNNYYYWIVANWHILKETMKSHPYVVDGVCINPVGLIEDMFGMYLVKMTDWNDYLLEYAD